MKAILCGIGEEARHYFSNYKAKNDKIACMVDKDPDPKGLPEELEQVPFITWEELASSDTYRKAGYRFVICSGKFYDEILDNLKRIAGEPVNAVSLDAYVHFEHWEGQNDLALRTVRPIPPECLQNARVLSRREDAPWELPKGGIAAEIGVATGYFSRIILNAIQLEKFYAVDIFSDHSKEFWGIRFDEKTHFEWYRDAFSKEIESGLLEMKRGMSWEVIAEFPDDHFDYVYVDAGHDYPSVKKDVEALIPKVKHGGIIQFNDYIIYDYESRIPYGIVPAVNKLVNDTESEVLYYCLSTNGFDDIVIRLNKKWQNS